MALKNQIISSQKVIFVDGIAGGGKNLISYLLASLPKIEHVNPYAAAEQICGMVNLKKLSLETADYLLKNNYNRMFYDTALLRNINFRKSDKSSVLNHPRYKFIKKRLDSNDKKVFSNYKNKIITHFLTHHISNHSEPIFRSFNKKLLFIRILRSPLNISIIKNLAKWSIKWEKMDSRDSQIKVFSKKFKKNFPHFIKDKSNEYLKANIYERAIMILESALIEKKKFSGFEKKYGSKIITIPFENLITKPNFYIQQVSKFLSLKIDMITVKEMRKNSVPRKFDLKKHDADGLRFIKNKVRKKYFNKAFYLNNYYHKSIINKH